MKLTDYASGGGCACKLPAAQLERMLSGFINRQPVDDRLVIGLEDGDDAAVIRLDPAGRQGLVMTTDFFTPVVNDPYDWGRIAAANALSDIYAVGGHPVSALNLLAWPVDLLPMEIASEVLRGGQDIATEAGCLVVGGHTITDPQPAYGLAVSGLVDLDRLMRIDAARAGLPLTLTKPLGVGVLNARLRATGQASAAAIDCMTILNREAAAAAVSHGARAATDVTGFGLLGHLYKMCRASGVSAVIDVAAVPMLEGARDAAEAGHVPGGSRRNLEWVAPHLNPGRYGELEQLLLADAQTSGGLLVAGEVPGYPVIGELRPAGKKPITLG
ncbi:MAG TPA: selenide, water dikinase SelD [Micromonosporaceae bacterium]|nr:selenide, water dikinase SelD [Micromonosporaceae bacterium]